jgi:hypothetical protein
MPKKAFDVRQRLFESTRFGHLVPDSIAVYSSVGLLGTTLVVLPPSAPLLEEERSVVRPATFEDLVDPFFSDRACGSTALATHYCPMDAS